MEEATIVIMVEMMTMEEDIMVTGIKLSAVSRQLSGGRAKILSYKMFYGLISNLKLPGPGSFFRLEWSINYKNQWNH